MRVPSEFMTQSSLLDSSVAIPQRIDAWLAWSGFQGAKKSVSDRIARPVESESHGGIGQEKTLFRQDANKTLDQLAFHEVAIRTALTGRHRSQIRALGEVIRQRDLRKLDEKLETLQAKLNEIDLLWDRFDQDAFELKTELKQRLYCFGGDWPGRLQQLEGKLQRELESLEQNLRIDRLFYSNRVAAVRRCRDKLARRPARQILEEELCRLKLELPRLKLKQAIRAHRVLNRGR